MTIHRRLQSNHEHLTNTQIAHGAIEFKPGIYNAYLNGIVRLNNNIMTTGLGASSNWQTNSNIMFAQSRITAILGSSKAAFLYTRFRSCAIR